MTTEIIFNTAIVFVCFVVLVAVGLWILNGMTNDDPHEQRFYGNDTSKLPKPPPEPEH